VRRLKHVDLRPNGDKRHGRFADLSPARQALRDQRASAFVLEQNRLPIVQAQPELARTLVPQHADAFA
jgi:hypothetical protein